MQVQKANKKANMRFRFMLMAKTELLKSSPPDHWADFEVAEKIQTQQRCLRSSTEGRGPF